MSTSLSREERFLTSDFSLCEHTWGCTHVRLALAAAEVGVNTWTESYNGIAVGQKAKCVSTKFCPGLTSQPKVGKDEPNCKSLTWAKKTAPGDRGLSCSWKAAWEIPGCGGYIVYASCPGLNFFSTCSSRGWFETRLLMLVAGCLKARTVHTAWPYSLAHGCLYSTLTGASTSSAFNCLEGVSHGIITPLTPPPPLITPPLLGTSWGTESFIPWRSLSLHWLLR